MAKSPKTAPVKGNDHARDVYISVGVALSYWEGSEDALMGIFHLLCAEREPTAFETYVASPRNRRTDMLKLALERYKARFQGTEKEQLLVAMKALDKLAPIRNEIAHGHCADAGSTVDGEVVMSGHYLLPSLNEGGWHERSYRFAHTTQSIDAFTEAVREHRWTVIQVRIAVMQREQKEKMGLDQETRMIMALAKSVIDGQIAPHDVSSYLKPLKTPAVY